MIQASNSNKIVCITTTCAFRRISGPQMFVGGSVVSGQKSVGRRGFKCTRIPLDLFNIACFHTKNSTFSYPPPPPKCVGHDSRLTPLSYLYMLSSNLKKIVVLCLPCFFNIVFHKDVNA